MGDHVEVITVGWEAAEALVDAVEAFRASPDTTAKGTTP